MQLHATQKDLIQQQSFDYSASKNRFSLTGWLAKARTQLSLWSSREKTRAQLSQMEAWQLEDLGLTREQADAEANKLFWQD